MPDERGAEFRGLGASDLLGLTPQSQFELAKWRILYSPGMWSKATTQGLNWPGTMLFGRSAVRGVYGGMGDFAERGGHKRTGSILRGAGTFFGGYGDRQPAGMFGPTPIMYRGPLDTAFSSGRGFSAARAGIADDIVRRKVREAAVGGIEFGGRTFYDFQYGGPSAQPSTHGTTYRGKMSGPGFAATYRQIPVTESLPHKEYAAWTAAQQRLANRQAMGISVKHIALRTMGVISTAATVGLAFELAALVGYGAVVGAMSLSQKLSGANFMDFGSGQFRAAQTQGATTERQRALQAIQAHHLNARRFIGNEAGLMHS